MPRDISRKRSSLGSGDVKNAPNVSDNSTQLAINEVYREINKLRQAVNSSANDTVSSPHEGRDGDVRLYTEIAKDGTKGYFIQGKFGESWASGRLSFDSVDPKQKQSAYPSNVPSYEDDGGGYITKSDVTYESLDENQDVGMLTGQVAPGSHVHDHDGPTITGTGSNSHAAIDNHIADVSIHREPEESNTEYEGTVTASTAFAGDNDKWAKSNHKHTLKQDETYNFTAKQTITVATNTTALEVIGDVDITGNLTVDFAESGTGNTDIAENLNIGKNVVLNDDSNTLSNNVNDTYTTTVHGKTTIYNETTIQGSLASGEKHLTISTDGTNKFEVDVSTQGVTTLTTPNSIDIAATSLRPDANLTRDLGQSDKRWRSIYAGELIVENLVAQDVMATIGGRIMVAPTSKLVSNLTQNLAVLDVEHDIFEVNDIGFMQKASGSGAQFEAIKITGVVGALPNNGGYRYTIQRNHDGGGPTGGNTWSIDDAIVNFGYEIGDGFIDITSTQSVYNNEGPTISLHARKTASSNWQVPEVARLGNFSGTGFTANDKFGIIVGKNLENNEQHATNPFQGLIGGVEGLKLFNTPIKMYDGSALNVLIGQDTSGDNVFAIGPDINETTYAGSSLLFKKTNGTYQLSIDGNIDLTDNLNFTIDSDDIMNSIDHFHPDTDMTGDARGLYLTPAWLGFWESTGSPYWPIKLGATASGTSGDPFFEIKNAPTNPTEYLRYTTADGLEIAGNITILSEKTPTILKVEANKNINVSLNQAYSNTLGFQNLITGFVYVHFRVENAHNGQIYFTDNLMDEPSPTWTMLSTGLTATGLSWFTAEINITGGNLYRAFQWKNVGTDSGNNHIIRDVVITRDRPGDPQSILQSNNAPNSYYQTTAPTGGVYNVGDQWFDTTLNNQTPAEPKNDLSIWNGTTWEQTFTQIDGGTITTGTIKGIALESIDTISDGTNTLPRVKLDLGGSNSLKQFNGGTLPNRYTELDGGVLKYVHEGAAGEGVQNSSNPLVYELPMAMQIIRADDLDLGNPITFNSIGLQNMYDSDYQIIPINETQIVTGAQNINDINNAGGIAREYLDYKIENKTNTGFTMKAKLYRGQYLGLLNDQNPTSSDQVDNLMNNNNTAYGDQTTGGVFNPADAPQPYEGFFSPSYDLSGGKYTFTEGMTNSTLIGGTNKIKVLVRHFYRELLYSVYDEWLGRTYYPGFPGTSHLYYMLRVGEGNGSPFTDDDTFFTVTPVGFGGDIETDNLRFTLTNEGFGPTSFGYEVDDYPSGSDSHSNYNFYSFQKEKHITYTFQTPGNNLLINPRVELLCFFHRRENSGSIGGIGYHSPTIKPPSNGDDVHLEYVRQGQVPLLIEEIEGTGYTGAIISKWNNISTGEPL